MLNAEFISSFSISHLVIQRIRPDQRVWDNILRISRKSIRGIFRSIRMEEEEEGVFDFESQVWLFRLE